MRRMKELDAIAEQLEDVRESRFSLLQERSDIGARKEALRNTAALIEQVGTRSKRSLRSTLATLVEDENGNAVAIRENGYQLAALDARHQELKAELEQTGQRQLITARIQMLCQIDPRLKGLTTLDRSTMIEAFRRAYVKRGRVHCRRLFYPDPHPHRPRGSKVS